MNFKDWNLVKKWMKQMKNMKTPPQALKDWEWEKTMRIIGADLHPELLDEFIGIAKEAILQTHADLLEEVKRKMLKLPLLKDAPLHWMNIGGGMVELEEDNDYIKVADVLDYLQEKIDFIKK